MSVIFVHRVAIRPRHFLVSAPASPSPPLPDPVVPKGAESPSPLPGQANDHSSPVFKGGGKEDPHK